MQPNGFLLHLTGEGLKVDFQHLGFTTYSDKHAVKHPDRSTWTVYTWCWCSTKPPAASVSRQVLFHSYSMTHIALHPADVKFETGRFWFLTLTFYRELTSLQGKVARLRLESAVSYSWHHDLRTGDHYLIDNSPLTFRFWWLRRHIIILIDDRGTIRCEQLVQGCNAAVPTGSNSPPLKAVTRD